MAEENNADRVIAAMAKSESRSDPRNYAFQAQTCYKSRDAILTKMLCGTVNYNNKFIRITSGIKVEHWLFCAEEGPLEDVYVGAFCRGKHYTFGALCPRGTPLQEEAMRLWGWVFNNALSHFYPEDRLFRDDNTIILKPHFLKTKRVVPNEQSVSGFLAEHPDLLAEL